MMVSDTELKELVKAIGDVEVLVSEISQGFSFSEISALVSIANDLPAVLKDASVMFPEWSSLDDAARADLVSYIQSNCKFPANVTVEVWAQKVLSAIVLLSSIFSVIKGA